MVDAYVGPETLALAMDIGTTQSAVSIVHCIGGQVPKVRVVSRWPSSPNSSKIPSIILYDRHGVARAFGAEAKEEKVLEQADDEKWKEARWFKLGLHASNMAPPSYEAAIVQGDDPGSPRSRNTSNPPEPPTTFEVPPLPYGVTTQQCYEDFMAYLYEHAKLWFLSNSPDGETIWKKLEGNLKLVIAHPNGWSLREQTILREAVVGAKIIKQSETEERVMFVTESEASVHFGLVYAGNQKSDWLSPKSSFAVVDGGGSTVDICVYEVEAQTPKLKLREAKTSDCTQSGAIFVTRAAEGIIKNKLGKSKFNTPEFLKVILDVFDAKTKVAFNSVDENYLIKFGYDRDTDKSAGVSRGRLTLTGAEVQKAFDPCVETILRSIEAQIAGTTVKSILLVGGFGESAYLQRRIREKFERDGVRVVTADEPSKKAVAEGGSLFFIKDTVVARATRFEFGVATMRPYEQYKDVAGFRSVVTTPRGSKYIRGGWTCIVGLGQVIQHDACHRRSFTIDFKETDLLTYSISLMSWRGPETSSGSTYRNGWSMDANGAFFDSFQRVCTVTADLSALAATQPLLTNHATGEKYRDLDFEICLFFGGTSLTACLAWRENGIEKKGKATVVPSTFL